MRDLLSSSSDALCRSEIAGPNSENPLTDANPEPVWEGCCFRFDPAPRWRTMALTMAKLSPVNNEFAFIRVGSRSNFLGGYQLVLAGARRQAAAKPF